MSEEEAGLIRIDGSSTVYPISEAVAEEFLIQENGRVVIGISGTGGGMEKFCNGEIIITGASRPVKGSEIEECERAGFEMVELPIAYDGIAVVVNPENDWVDYLTVDELRMMWEPAAQNTITRWNQIRSEWPNEDITLLGPGVDSGTFDYFTEAIMGEGGASRGDFQPNEDDNVLVRGVATDTYATAFFGFAYYDENRDKIRAVPIVNEPGDAAIAPTMETISEGTYLPLTRPLMIYVRADRAQDEAVARFVHFYIDNASELVPDVGFVPLPDSTYDRIRERFATVTTGTLFGHGESTGVTVDQLLDREAANE